MRYFGKTLYNYKALSDDVRPDIAFGGILVENLPTKILFSAFLVIKELELQMNNGTEVYRS